jgi:hypothetical protein
MKRVEQLTAENKRLREMVPDAYFEGWNDHADNNDIDCRSCYENLWKKSRVNKALEETCLKKES